MKKFLNKICLFLLVLLFGINKVKANTIHNINMDVYIDANGNASITEVWNTNIMKGTEGYRSYSDLGDSKISDFRVSDETGANYTSLYFWKTEAKFSEKAYKSGINETVDGIELCWGISDYGNKIYTLKYNISNLVSQYTDSQGIYFNFINLNQPVNKAKITIRSDIPFSLDNAKIWAFGYEGKINFKDGSIVLETDGKLSNRQYMVALIKFEENMFNVSSSSSQSFDEVYASAMLDAEKEEEFPLIDWLVVLFYLVIIIGFLYVVGKDALNLYLCDKKGSEWVYGSNEKSGYLDFDDSDRKLPKEEEIEYWREIPCDKDLERAYWVLYNYRIVSTATLKEGIIGAVLLKWIKDGDVTVIKTKKGQFSFKDNGYAIDLSKFTSSESKIENNLLKILKKAAGINNILEATELKKWCKKNYKEMKKWFDEIEELAQKELEKQGLIYDIQKETKASYGRTKKIVIKKVKNKLKEDAIHMLGLKKFLLDFSNVPEREYFQVHIWEEYLIFAQLLGIADKVEEQFSKLYPKFNDESKLNLNITTIAVKKMARLSYHGMSKAYEKSLIRKEKLRRFVGSGSSSSGSGGSSYRSGGSSARGSSGGGFR